MFIGAGLPDETDIEAMEKDEFWRVVFGTPLISCLILQSAFLFFIRTDSIVFNLKSDNKADALSLISRVYISDPEEIYNSL